jgi:oligopeptide transport system permease protein
MTGFIIRRLLSTIPVLLIIALVTFLLMHSAPGGPWDRNEENGKEIPAAIKKLLDQEFGLDKPLWRQFTGYIIGDFRGPDETFKCGAICGNLGLSSKQRGRSVQEILFTTNDENATWLASKFGFSVRLAVYALLFAVILGIPLGVIAAIRQNTALDFIITLCSNVGVAVPNLVMGVFLIIIFGVQLKLLPVVAKEWDTITPWILPSLTYGLGTMARMASYTRTTMLDVMRQDYVRTARAKGAIESIVIWKHMFRNTLIPVITILGPALAGLIVSGVTIEAMFGFPGMGFDFFRAIGNRDYSMIMGTSLIFAVIIVIANMSVDILYGLVDPRIRVE